MIHDYIIFCQLPKGLGSDYEVEVGFKLWYGSNIREFYRFSIRMYVR